MFKFIIGSSRSDKSNVAYKAIIDEAVKNPDKQYIIIVPEQQTLTTQKRVVSLHPSKCIMNIDVLSFNRLAYRVFEELGIDYLDGLDDTAKSLIIRHIAIQHESEFKYLGAGIRKPQFIGQVKSVISEFMQYNQTPEDIRKMCQVDGMSKVFGKKMDDLLIIYEAFLEYLEGDYITSETILKVLSSRVEESKILSGATFLFDGFTGFTPVQYELLDALLAVTDDLSVTICADENTNIYGADQTDLFYMSSDFVRRLSACAKARQIQLGDVEFVKEQSGDNEVLSHLGKNIYRDKINVYENGSVKASDVIKISALKNPYEEMRRVAITISDLVKNQGYSFKDIAIVASDLEMYEATAQRVMREIDIPIFVDTKTKLNFNPFIEALDAALAIIETDFSKDSVIRFLRNGLNSLAVEEVDELDNFLTACGIRGSKKFVKNFVTRRKNYTAKLEKINEIRKRFILPFDALIEVSKSESATVEDYATALYSLIVNSSMEELLLQYKNSFEEENDARKVLEYSQVYKIVIDILDKLVMCLKDEIVDVGEFRDLLSAAINSCSIGIIPENDVVLMGNLSRSRLDNIKVLFLVGATDSLIPSNVEAGGILSAMERQTLIDSGYDLAPSERQKAFRERFYIYLALTKPEDRLYISYMDVNAQQEAQLPSSLIADIINIFSEISVDRYDEKVFEECILSEEWAREYLIELLSNYGEDYDQNKKENLGALLKWYENNFGIDQLFDGAFFKYVPSRVRVWDDSEINISVTQLEKYLSCPYKYFAASVLKLSEKENFSLENYELGNIYHKILEKYVSDIKDWKNLSSEEIETKSRKAIASVKIGVDEEKKGEEATIDYLVDRIEPLMMRTLKVITAQIQKGEFTNIKTEHKFKKHLLTDIDEKKNVFVSGVIDRIDMTDTSEDGKTRLRIVDYKSSPRSIDLVEAYHGISIQLPLYLHEIKNVLQAQNPDVEYESSALQYYIIDDPFVEKSHTSSTEEIDNEIAMQLRFKGRVITDKEALIAMDENFETDLQSSVHRAKLNKTGELSSVSKSELIDADLMDALADRVYEVSKEAAKGISEGEFEIKPYAYKSKKGCDYCSYKSLCGFETTLGGFDYKVVKDTEEDVIKKLSDQ